MKKPDGTRSQQHKEVPTNLLAVTYRGALRDVPSCQGEKNLLVVSKNVSKRWSADPRAQTKGGIFLTRPVWGTGSGPANNPLTGAKNRGLEKRGAPEVLTDHKKLRAKNKKCRRVRAISWKVHAHISLCPLSCLGETSEVEDRQNNVPWVESYKTITN